MLVMSFLTLFVLIILDQKGKISIEENPATFLISTFVVILFTIAWLTDIVSTRRSTFSTVHRFKTSLCDDLLTYETPFVLRVTSSPMPIVDFDERYRKIIKAAHYWDWTIYVKVGSPCMNQAMLAEIQSSYLSKPISTSTFGIINDNWMSQGDQIIIGVVRSKQRPAEFIKHPWELGKEQRRSLYSLRAYSCRACPPNSHSFPSLTNCRIFDSPTSSFHLLERLLEKIGTAQRSCWSIHTKQDWEGMDKNAILSHLRAYFSQPPDLALRTLSWNRLRTWLACASKPAIAIGFVGYMLSPFSPYNDVVVNIAPSYFLARWTAICIPLGIPVLTAVYYILSNILGIVLLWLSVRKLTGRIFVRPSWTQLAFAVVWMIASFIFLLWVDLLNLLKQLGVGL
jgi:hypothetical protein